MCNFSSTQEFKLTIILTGARDRKSNRGKSSLVFQWSFQKFTRHKILQQLYLAQLFNCHHVLSRSTPSVTLHLCVDSEHFLGTHWTYPMNSLQTLQVVQWNSVVYLCDVTSEIVQISIPWTHYAIGPMYESNCIESQKPYCNITSQLQREDSQTNDIHIQFQSSHTTLTDIGHFSHVGV